MIGIIICCHGDMAAGMKNATELIVGPQQNMEAIGLHPGQGQDDLRRALKKALRTMGKEGAVILTDLPGGTPCNVSAMLMSDTVRMIAGVNLPMLVKLAIERQLVTDLSTLVDGAPAHGAEHIIDGKTLLKG